MKRKTAIICLLFLVMALAVACGPKKEDKEADKKQETEQKDTDEKADIELTLPATFFDEEGMTDLNEEAKAEGVEKVTVNDDGSVTYTMTKETHEKLLMGVKEKIDEMIGEMLEDKESYASYTDITYNDDVTEFTVLVDKASYGGTQSFGALQLYAAGNMYQGVNLIPEEEINTAVQFVDKDTQEVIESGDSKSVGQDYQDS